MLVHNDQLCLIMRYNNQEWVPIWEIQLFASEQRGYIDMGLALLIKVLLRFLQCIWSPCLVEESHYHEPTRNSEHIWSQGLFRKSFPLLVLGLLLPRLQRIMALKKMKETSRWWPPHSVVRTRRVCPKSLQNIRHGHEGAHQWMVRFRTRTPCSHLVMLVHGRFAAFCWTVKWQVLAGSFMPNRSFCYHADHLHCPPSSVGCITMWLHTIEIHHILSAMILWPRFDSVPRIASYQLYWKPTNKWTNQRLNHPTNKPTNQL